MTTPRVEQRPLPERVTLRQMTITLEKSMSGYGPGDDSWTPEDEEAAFVAFNGQLYVEIDGEWRLDPPTPVFGE